MSKFNKLITGVAAMSLLLSVPLSASADSIGSVESQSTYSVETQSGFSVKTPEEYISYLKQTHVGSSNEESSRTKLFISQFKSLPRDKQQQFVDYLNDPEFLNTAFTAINEQTEASQTFYNGDLTVSSSSVMETFPSSPSVSIMAKGDTKDHALYYEDVINVFGLDMVKTRVELSYRTTEVQTNSSQITSILNKQGTLVQNYTPGAHITKTEHNVVISSDKTTAKFTVDWSWNFLWDKLGLTVGTKRQWIEVNKAGTGYGGIYNL